MRSVALLGMDLKMRRGRYDPADLITSLIILAVAIYAARYVYRAIKLSRLAPIGRALISYLFITAVDRIISAVKICRSKFDAQLMRVRHSAHN